MSIKTSIAREEEYKKQLFAHYNSILDGRLMRIDPDTANDSAVASFITDFDQNESYDNNCCSWLKIGDIEYSNYNGNDFAYINLLPLNGQPIQINFSQFRYRMSARPGGIVGFTSFDPKEAVHLCTIDGNGIDPESFFSAQKGKRLLYLYSFEAITAFNQSKRCFRFAFNDTSNPYIRRYIRSAQIAVLEKYLSNPSTDIPVTSIKIEIEGAESSRPSYHHSVKGDIVDAFALNIFEESFRSKFLEKLRKITPSDKGQ